MVNEKGLSEDAADQIGSYVSMKGEIFLSLRRTVAVGNLAVLPTMTSSSDSITDFQLVACHSGLGSWTR